MKTDLTKSQLKYFIGSFALIIVLLLIIFNFTSYTFLQSLLITFGIGLFWILLNIVIYKSIKESKKWTLGIN